jgi:4-hydroxy-tetrahydrodipicolinate synthase
MHQPARSHDSADTLIEGTLPALVTPFDERGRVDLDAMEEHVAWLRERGIRTISALGTTGEGPSLSVEERKHVIRRLADQVALVAGTGCTALPETVELSRFAAEAGATGLLVAPPSYFRSDDRGVRAYFEHLFDALPAEARVVLYHIPRVTGVPITSALLGALQDRFGGMLVGVKDSAGDFEHTNTWLREFPELVILNGSDATAAAHYEAGGRGTITMLANLFPDRLERIRGGAPGDQRFLAEVRRLVAGFPEIAAVKHLLHSLTGLPRSSVRPPLRDLDDTEARRLEARFAEIAP